MTHRIKGTDLVYFPVPKIACSSLKNAILKHNDPALYKDVREKRRPGLNVHGVYPTRRFSPLTPLLHARGRWFCVVRDPLERLASAYSNRVAQYGELSESAVGKEKLAAEGLEADPDFETFARNLAGYRKVSSSIAHHTAPLTFFLGAKPERFDRIFSVRRMAELIDWCAEAGAKLEVGREKSDGPKVPVSSLSTDARRSLRDFYRKDYGIWGPWLKD